MPPARGPARPASIALTTLGSADAAAQLARRLVEERLAACGTVVPGVRSVYAWKGAIEESAEAMLVLKTTPGREAALVRRLRELHPYELPEVILGRPRADGAYLRWVAGWVEPPRARSRRR